MVPDHKVNSFLQTLVEKSRRGEIRWTATEAKDQQFEHDEESPGLVYLTELGDNQLRLAQLQYKYWKDEDDFEWVGSLALDFVDSEGRLLWRFPATRNIRDLFDLVRIQTSGIEEAIDEFLGVKRRGEKGRA